MKKKKFAVIGLLMALGISLLMMPCGRPVMAEESDIQSIEQSASGEKPTDASEVGKEKVFSSKDDGTLAGGSDTEAESYKKGDLIYRKTLAINTGLVRVDKAYYKSKTNIKKGFVRYLTESWAKASQYVWSKSNSVEWEISGGADVSVSKAVALKMGLSRSRTTSYGISVTIPAVKNKYSKLGFASDYTKFVYTHKRYMNDKLQFKKNTTLKTPKANSYLIVYYK